MTMSAVPQLVLADRPPLADESRWPSWRNEANCLDTPTAMWFPEPGVNDYAACRAICGACTVRAECLDDTLRSDHGFSGGMTPRERAAELSRRLRATS